MTSETVNQSELRNADATPATVYPVAPVVNFKTEDEPDDSDLLSANDLAESLTGFDQIAIRQRWNQRFDEIAADQIMLLRVLYFIHLRRENGAGREGDKTAFNEAMECPLNALQDKYKNAEKDEDGEDLEDESAIAERDREFAEFVMASGLSYTVDQYMALTLSQRSAVLDVAAKRR